MFSIVTSWRIEKKSYFCASSSLVYTSGYWVFSKERSSWCSWKVETYEFKSWDQDLGQLADQASDSLFFLVQPIRSQLAWHKSWLWLQLINFHSCALMNLSWSGVSLIKMDQSSSHARVRKLKRKFIVVVIVKSFVKKQAGSWLAAQECTTNQKPGQQVDPTLENDFNS